MSQFWLKKLGIFLAFMLLLSLFTFALARIAPGDPLQSFYGDAVEHMTASEHEAARERLGLNQPIPTQYLKWLSGVSHGEFGLSFKYKRPALEVVEALIGNTLILGVSAYILVFFLAIIVSVLCVLYEGRFIDKMLCQIGTLFYYLPTFWLGLILILIFSVNLHLLPSGGAYSPGQSDSLLNRSRYLILPLTVMVISHVWYYAYLIRNKLLEEVRKDYVLFAKSKGLNRLQILYHHCLRNVAPAIISLMAISITHVLSGTYVVEFVFAYPGLGALAIESAKYHDYNLLMLVVLLTGFLVIVASLLAETVNEFIDPRMRIQGVKLWSQPKKDL